MRLQTENIVVANENLEHLKGLASVRLWSYKIKYILDSSLYSFFSPSNVSWFGSYLKPNLGKISRELVSSCYCTLD